MTNTYSEEYIKKHMGAEFVGQYSNFNMYKNDSIFFIHCKECSEGILWVPILWVPIEEDEKKGIEEAKKIAETIWNGHKDYCSVLNKKRRIEMITKEIEMFDDLVIVIKNNEKKIKEVIKEKFNIDIVDEFTYKLDKEEIKGEKALCLRFKNSHLESIIKDKDYKNKDRDKAYIIEGYITSKYIFASIELLVKHLFEEDTSLPTKSYFMIYKDKEEGYLEIKTSKG